MTRKPTAAVAAAAILAAGFGAMLALNLPGQMSYDSVSQLLDGRSGHYNSWHPPVMAWLLGIFDAALPGTALFVGFEAALLALAFGLSLRRRARWAAAAVALAIILTPQFLLFQGIVWKDVLFADAMVAAFAALASAAARPAADRARPVLLILFFLLLTLAGLARQNGMLLLPIGALTLGWATAAGSTRRAIHHGVAALGLLAVLAIAANLLLAIRADGGQGMRDEIRLAQVYDLTGAVHRGYRLDRLSRSDPRLAQRIATDGVKAYSLRLEDTLEPALGLQTEAAPADAIFAQWKALVLERPDLYLRERLPLFWQVLATPDIALCHPAFVGIEGDREQLRALGLTARVRPQDLWLADYVRGFMGTPVLSHLAFGALALVLLAFYLRRRRPADIAMAGLLAGALTFAASFLFVSVACDYRYIYPLDLSAMVALFHLFAAPKPEAGRAKAGSPVARRRDMLLWRR